VAAAVPVETAQELCAELTGLSLSDHTGHAVGGELSHQLDVLEVRPTAAAMAERVAERAVGQTWRPVVGWAIDGALVPTRPEEATGAVAGRRHTRAQRAGWPGEWQEATGVRVSLVERERIVPLLSWDQGCRDEDGGAARRRVQEAGVLPEAPGRWCVIGDGAPWIWNQVSALLPTAVPILDDDHGRAHGPKGASRPCGDDAGQAQEWGEATMARLCWGSVHGASEGVQALPPREAQAAEEIRQLIGFLRNREERRHDRGARKGGDPIGSGGIEAANKSISHVRLKRSGAWWDVEQANHRLALRCAPDHGTFERVFEISKRKALQKHRGDPL